MHSVFGIGIKRIKNKVISSKIDTFISVLSYFISKQVWIFQEKKFSKKIVPKKFSGVTCTTHIFLFGLDKDFEHKIVNFSYPCN